MLTTVAASNRIEPVEKIVLRLDAATVELVGYTILDCRKRFGGVLVEQVTLPLVPAAALLPLRAHLRFLVGAVRAVA